MAQKPDINISTGVILSIAVFMFCSTELILPLICAVLIHEFGHIAAILILGGKISTLTVNACGLKLTYNSMAFSYLQDIICALMGPLFGIISAFLAAQIGLTIFAGICLCISLFNLLPVRPLDGGKILWSINMLLLNGKAETIMRIIEITVLIVLISAALYVYAVTKKYSLLLIAAVLTFYYCKER